MDRGHIILLAGAVLIVVGISLATIWGVSFAGSFVNENTLIGMTAINPGQSASVGTDVSRLDKAISLTVAVEHGDERQSQNAMLRGTITDPAGRTVSSQDFGDSFVTSFRPQEAGVYTANITNLGQQPVTISGTFGYLPFFDSEGEPDLKEIIGSPGLGMVIAGGIMTVAGIMALIVGGIVTVADGRKRPGSAAGSTTPQDGITYKKD